MGYGLDFQVDTSGLTGLHPGRLDKAIARALRKAAATAARDMRSEASKRVRASLRLKAGIVRKALVADRQGKTIDDIEARLRVRGGKMPLIAYPSVRQVRKGVSVGVAKGKRSLAPRAFVATMRSGHRGVFRRKGRGRLPIRELYAPSTVDVLLRRGEAEKVADRGRTSLQDGFGRLLPLELDKVR